MKPHCPLTAVALIHMTLLSAVAADKVPARLVGTWTASIEVDEAKVKQVFKDMNVPEGAQEQALELIKSQLSNMKVTIAINADGSTNSALAGIPSQSEPKKVKANWSIVEETEKLIKIKSKDSEGIEETLTLVFAGKDKFTLEVPTLKQAPVKSPIFVRDKNGQR